MYSATLDTNTLVSATIARGKEYALFELAKKGKFRLLISLSILLEYKRIISAGRFGYTSEFVEELVSSILGTSDLVFPEIKLDVVKEDPNDNKILECAVAGKADFIVSGDKHLLKLKKYKGIKIVRTSDFLTLL
jgi:putative PIN family toxin of toxin-antitoxin system